MRYKGTILQQEAGLMAGVAAAYLGGSREKSQIPAAWQGMWEDWSEWLAHQHSTVTRRLSVDTD